MKPILKKSQGFEFWIFVIVIMLAAAIVFLILNKAWSSVKPELDTGLQSALQGHDYSNANISKTLEQTSSTTKGFDKLMPFLIIGLFAFVLIGAGAIMQHPVMIFVGIIVLGVILVLSVIYANLYNSISSASEFSSTKADLPITDKFMQYLPVIVFLMAIGIAISIIWAKSSGGGTL